MPSKSKPKAKPANRRNEPAKPAPKKARAKTKAPPKTKAAPKTKVAPKTKAAAKTKPRARGKTILLSGGNPQIAKGEGEAPVRAYIAAMPGWKRDIGERLDALIVRQVPKVKKAVKWNSPFYGLDGKGWFCSFHVFARYVKVTFFKGALLRPPPPGASKHDEVRYLDIYEDDFDEVQTAKWVKQAAALPGWLG